MAALRAVAAAASGGGDVAGTLAHLAACLTRVPDRAVELIRQGLDLEDVITVAVLAGTLIKAGAPGLAVQVLAASPITRHAPLLALLEVRAWCDLARRAAEAGLAAHPGAAELAGLMARSRAPWPEKG